MFNLRALYLGLDEPAKQRFCSTAGTTDRYIRNHLMRAARMPRKDLMDRLVKACQEVDASVTREMVVMFFHDPPLPSSAPAAATA